jgi:hypothetical protein
MRSDQYGVLEDNCPRTKHVAGNYCVGKYNKKLLYCGGIKIFVSMNRSAPYEKERR